MNKNQEAFDLAKEIINDSPYELWTPEQSLRHGTSKIRTIQKK